MVEIPPATPMYSHYTFARRPLGIRFRLALAHDASLDFLCMMICGRHRDAWLAM